MFEYIFIGLLATGIIVLYYLINSKKTGRLIVKTLMRPTSGSMSGFYMERFSEHRGARLGNNILIQVFPWLCVLALVYILSHQYFIFGTVLSGSMEPTFSKGDMVLMQTFDKKVKVGDIVMFPMFGMKEPITHRVVAITGEGNIVTRGDHNPVADGQGFPPNRIMGKAIIIGDQPVLLKGFGYYIRPENIGEFQVLTKLPANFAIAKAFEQFQAVQPLIIFFATIFYFFILIESRTEYNRRFNDKKKNGGKSTGKVTEEH